MFYYFVNCCFLRFLKRVVVVQISDGENKLLSHHHVSFTPGEHRGVKQVRCSPAAEDAASQFDTRDSRRRIIEVTGMMGNVSLQRQREPVFFFYKTFRNILCSCVPVLLLLLCCVNM